jgi:hypothetical protein
MKRYKNGKVATDARTKNGVAGKCANAGVFAQSINTTIAHRIVILIAVLMSVLPTMAQQVIEPDFIGNAYLIKTDNSNVPLDKEFGDFTSGMSWSSNSWNARSLEIAGGKANTRFPSGKPLQLVVRAVDNNSDPLTIISIYKLKAKKKTRSVVLSEDNSGTLMKSRTHNAKNMVRFSGKKYGTSSYLINLEGLKVGEYGIIVSNPNNRDEKRVVVSCFAIDK